MKPVTQRSCREFRVMCTLDFPGEMPMSAPHPSTVSQPVRIVVVMDPISRHQTGQGHHRLKRVLAAPGARLGLWYAEQRDLWLRDGVPMGGSRR